MGVLLRRQADPDTEMHLAGEETLPEVDSAVEVVYRGRSLKG